MINNNQDILLNQFNSFLLNKSKVYGSNNRLYISKKSNVNNGLFNTASGSITIKDYVFFGHNVSIIAATHDINKYGAERMQSIPSEGYDIVIEEGAWIGTNSIILGPCHIGKDAVIAAGSVVTKNVDNFELVGGVPAKFIKKLKSQE